MILLVGSAVIVFVLGAAVASVVALGSVDYALLNVAGGGAAFVAAPLLAFALELPWVRRLHLRARRGRGIAFRATSLHRVMWT